MEGHAARDVVGGEAVKLVGIADDDAVHVALVRLVSLEIFVRLDDFHDGGDEVFGIVHVLQNLFSEFCALCQVEFLDLNIILDIVFVGEGGFFVEVLIIDLGITYIVEHDGWDDDVFITLRAFSQEPPGEVGADPRVNQVDGSAFFKIGFAGIP